MQDAPRWARPDLSEPPEDTIPLRALGASLSLEAIYRGRAAEARLLDRAPRFAYKAASE